MADANSVTAIESFAQGLIYAFISSSILYWLVVLATFLPCVQKILRWFAKWWKRQKTQSAALEPMIRMPTTLEPDEEPADELGVFSTFASRFGMQWIRASSTTRCCEWTFKFTFFFFWSLSLAVIITLFHYVYILESFCANRDAGQSAIFAKKCDFVSSVTSSRRRAQIIELSWPHIASIGNPFLVWFHWRRVFNPLTETLLHMRNSAPDVHCQCCKFVKRVSDISVFFSIFASSAIYIVPTVLSDNKILDPQNDLKDGWSFFIFPFFMLPSHIMVATFAFIFYIARHRLRSFIRLVHFAHTSSRSVELLEIPELMRTLNCPIAAVFEWTRIVQNGNMENCENWMRLQLHRLWMAQISQVNTMVKHIRAWLGFQALVLLIQLIAFAFNRFAFRASAETTNVFHLSYIQSILRTFVVLLCPFSALFFLALTRKHIDQACLQIEAALETASSVSDSSIESTLKKDVCNGDDSLGTLATFCRASSANAVQVFGLPFDFLSLIRYSYYIVVTFGLVAANISNIR